MFDEVHADAVGLDDPVLHGLYPKRASASLTIGCTLPTSGGVADPSAIGAMAQAAEDLGFDSVWISDHVVVPERIDSFYQYAKDGRFPTPPTQAYLEPLSAMGYLAGRTVYKFEALGGHPHPYQKPHPPIWVGGHTAPALRRTARFGDGWLPIGGRPPADLPPRRGCAMRCHDSGASAR
jgi:alkanesulfonate monooxygenase SsuD/methylene tetrahydromethanopterin reductase-like flavin-dependent oxidoreductase (luciferase family)